MGLSPGPASPEPTRIARVMGEVRRRVAGRALGPGARLPSIRASARAHGVSNATVVEAYERLAAEGMIVARPGSGFYVADRVRPLVLAEAAPAAEREVDPLWMMRQSLQPGLALLAPGCGWLPDGWMPVEAIRRAVRAAAREDGAGLAAYGSPAGYGPLREHLARRLGERGVEVSPGRVLILDSGTQALDLVARMLLAPGDAMLVDDPAYFNFIALGRAHRARIFGVPMTPSGPDLAAFAELAARHRPRLYVTTAAPHNPTGASLAPAVAHRLLKLAELHDVVVVEDDIFADLDPEPASPRLAAFDGLARVIQIGSFSKTLSAAVRCGFVAARPDWIEALTDLKLATTFGAGELSGRIVHGLLTDGSYRRHVERLRGKLARALGETASRLRRAGLAPWILPRGGLFVWAELPDGLDAAAVARHALRRGVMLAPGPAFSVGGGAASFLRFNAAQSGDPLVYEVLREAMRGAA